MAVLFSSLLFFLLCTITFFPGMHRFYAKNPAFMGMIFTVSACFLGVFAASEFSRSEERHDRMARAANLMDMTKESLSANRIEARILSQLEPEARGRDRRHHLNGYLRESAFAHGVLAAEAEFQRGNIRRGDLTEILQEWTVKKSLPQILTAISLEAARPKTDT
ncbi:MAG: hypothetical protein ABIW76_01250 [Fibrobacteria bacterium]